MPITVECENRLCRAKVKASDERAGSVIRCLACGESIRVPIPYEAPSLDAGLYDAAELSQTDILPAAMKSTGNQTGRCWIRIRRDQIGLNQEVHDRFEEYIETEALSFEFDDLTSPPPKEPNQNDLVVTGQVDLMDPGSQFMRYMFTFVTIFGPGASKLQVSGEIHIGEAEPEDFSFRSQIGAGVFGGNNDGLMKTNVKAVGRKVAKAMARAVSERKFLNAQAYSCAKWSLALGLASIIPMAGWILAPISFLTGAIALNTISKRSLPRGTILAIVGIIAGCCGIVCNLIFLKTL